MSFAILTNINGSTTLVGTDKGVIGGISTELLDALGLRPDPNITVEKPIIAPPNRKWRVIRFDPVPVWADDPGPRLGTREEIIDLNMYRWYGYDLILGYGPLTQTYVITRP